MPLTDYAQPLERLQKALATAWLSEPTFINDPVGSHAFKIDPDYYLLEFSGFLNDLARASGILSPAVLETLLHTGMLVSRGPDHAHVLEVGIIRPGHGAERLIAGFAEAGFIDRALRLYAEAPVPSLSDVRLDPADRPRVEAFFGVKPPPASLAYGVTV